MQITKTNLRGKYPKSLKIFAPTIYYEEATRSIVFRAREEKGDKEGKYWFVKINPGELLEIAKLYREMTENALPIPVRFSYNKRHSKTAHTSSETGKINF